MAGGVHRALANMEHPKILIQLDTDHHASVFDAVVAVDSGVDHLLQYASVNSSNVTGLVHGAMFTRGPAQLSRTAVFIGGSNTRAGEELLSSISSTFFGPIRVSVMLDSNGSNTTAAAAVLCAARHLDLTSANALVLGGTGPVGGRVARILIAMGATVTLVSRDPQRAEQASAQILAQLSAQQRGSAVATASSSHSESGHSEGGHSEGGHSEGGHSESGHSEGGRSESGLHGRLLSAGMTDRGRLQESIAEASLIVSCGAAGVELLDQSLLSLAVQAKVAIDLNAVPPAGIFGIAATDKAVERDGRIDYGAIGVGGLKMKIHRAAIHELFQRNDQILNVDQIYRIGQQLEAGSA
jgi:NAD(P)-dependent dehydrogenase (short-subunit alcohol dehydrogenase family)